MITKFDKYISESLKDKMSPKSDNDIKDVLDKLPVERQLYWACKMGLLNVVKRLSEDDSIFGIDPSSNFNEYIKTAWYHNNYNIVEYLLKDKRIRETLPMVTRLKMMLDLKKHKRNSVKTFEKFYIEGDVLYHYTTMANAMKIIRSNTIKSREMDLMNKHTSNPYLANNYGFVSFTEDEEYHENSESLIPTECRFVFSISQLEKGYELVKHDANEMQRQMYLHDNDLDEDDMDDLDSQDILYFGEEMEIRIYSDIPLKKYVKSLETWELFDDNPLKKELAQLCKENRIEFKENAY